MRTAALQAWPDNLESQPPLLYTGAYGNINGGAEQRMGSGEPCSGSGQSQPSESKDSGRANSTGSGDTVKPTVITAASAKNRAAQRRYRERQKGKMETFKSQVDELSHQLQQLQSEKDSLENRNRMLERVMQIKGELDNATGVARPLVVPEPAQDNLYMAEDSYVSLAGLINAVRVRSGVKITPQEAVDMQLGGGGQNPKFEFMKKIRAEFVSQIAEQLVAHGDHPGTEGYRQLEEYVLGHRLAKVKLFNSMSLRSFAQAMANKAKHSMVQPVTPQFMESMHLSLEQKHAYIRVRRDFLERTENIREKRQAIVKELASVPSMAQVKHTEHDVMLRALEASEAYRNSLEEEHQSMVEFHLSCHAVITPIQEARAMLELFPQAPDLFSVTGYLEAEQNGTLDAWLKEQADSQAQRPGPGPGSEYGPSSSGHSHASDYTCQICTGAALEFAKNRAIKAESTGMVLPQPFGFVPVPEPAIAPAPTTAPASVSMPLQPTAAMPNTGLAASALPPSAIPPPQPADLLDPFDPGMDLFDDNDVWLDLFPGLASMEAA